MTIRSVSRCKIDSLKWGSHGWPVLKFLMDLNVEKLGFLIKAPTE